MSVHVFIATTQGPLAIQSIIAEDPDIQSVVCVDGGIEPLPISQSYHHFIRRGTGVIQRDFGGAAYRMDLAGSIEHGLSWQLPVYLAHYLKQQGCLGNGQPQPGDQVVWATGAVKADGSVDRVEEIARKYALSEDLFQQLKHLAIKPWLMLPSAEADEYSAIKVSHVDQALQVLNDALRPLPSVSVSSPPPSPKVQSGLRRHAWHWVMGLSLGLLLLSGAWALGAARWFLPLEEREPLPDVSQPSPQEAPFALSLTATFAPALGDCQAATLTHQSLVADPQGTFPDVALDEGLCQLLFYASPEQVLLGVALDTGGLLPIELKGDTWSLPLPTQTQRDRPYVLLLLSHMSLVEARARVRSGLRVLLLEQDPRDLLRASQLQNLLNTLDVEGQIYQHRLLSTSAKKIP